MNGFFYHELSTPFVVCFSIGGPQTDTMWIVGKRDGCFHGNKVWMCSSGGHKLLKPYLDQFVFVFTFTFPLKIQRKTRTRSWIGENNRFSCFYLLGPNLSFRISNPPHIFQKSVIPRLLAIKIIQCFP